MKTDVVCVYQGHPMEAEMIKEMLGDNNIVASVKNQLLSQLVPFQVSGGGALPAEVEVLAADQKAALALINELFSKDDK